MRRRSAAHRRIEPSTDAPLPPEPGEPGSASWHVLTYRDDPWAQRVVAKGPTGLVEVGECFGLKKSRVQQIEQQALAKLRIGLEIEALVGIEQSALILRRLRGKHLEDYDLELRRLRRKARGSPWKAGSGE